MRFLTILSILLSNFCLYSQDCKLQTIKDEFTGDETLTTGMVAIENSLTNKGGQSSKTEFGLMRTGGQLVFAVKMYVRNVSTINAGDIFYMKFKDGEIMQLENPSHQISDFEYNALSQMNENVFVLTFFVEPEQIELLASKQIDKCKIDTSKGSATIETSDRIAKRWMGCAATFKDAIE